MICFPLHPATLLFPEMGKEDFEKLVESIRTFGQLEPVWTYKGELIDGRHRQEACKILGLDVVAREWSGEGSLTDFVIGLNVGRRHLTPGQKAMAAFHALPMYEAEAKERQRAAGIERATHADRNESGQLNPKLDEAGKPNGKVAVIATSEEPPAPKKPEPQALAKAAAAFGVSKQYIADVKAIAKASPEKFAKLEAGKTTIAAAKAEIAEEKGAPPKAPCITDATSYASTAMNQLSRIKDDDPLAVEGLQRVRDYIVRRLENIAKTAQGDMP